MKKIVLILGLLISTQLAFTQAPEKINYQALARDASGNPLVNQTLNVTYQIRQSSPTGTSVYTETHSGISTNQFGLFTAEIGGGTPSVGTFAGINWGAGLYYLYLEVNGDPMGSSQLLSVPYALYAKQSANGPQGLPGRNSISIVTPEPAGANCQNGGNKIDVGTDDNGDNILQALEIDFTYFVCNGDSGTAVGDDWGNQVVTTQGSNISGDGTTANPLTVTNNDNDSTNELQDLSIAGNTINITNGTGITLSSTTPTTNQVLTWNGTAWTAQNATSGADNWGSQVVVSDATLTGDGTTGNPLGVNGVLTDNQDLSLTGNSLSLTNDPTPVDLSPYLDNTDAQTLSINANTLAISNGNSVTLPTSPWAKTGSTLHPTIIGDNVGIGTINATSPLTINTLSGTEIAFVGTFNADISSPNQMNIIAGGLLSNSGNEIKLRTNNTDRLTVLNNGNIGIGTTSPLAKFHVEENASAVILLKEVTPTNGAAFVMESLNQYVLLSNESGTFRIENVTNSLQPFNINPSGQVGIGGDASNSSLDVYGKITMRNGATNGYIPVSDANGTMTWTDPNSVISITPSPWSLNGTYIHPTTITNDVGIGTITPEQKLDVIGYTRIGSGAGNANMGLLLATPAPGISLIRAGGRAYTDFRIIQGNSAPLTLHTSDLERLRIDGNGNVGIGTTTPGLISGATKYLSIVNNGPYNSASITSLELKGNTNAGNSFSAYIDFINGLTPTNIAKIGATTSNTSTVEGQLTFSTNDGTLSERMRITQTGNVGIGTTTPSAKLDVDNGGSIEVDGEYTYETPKTHYYSVAGNSFVGTREGLDLWNASLNLIYGQWSSGSATYPIAVAPVNLPDGATITDVTAYIYDNDGTITYQPRIILYTIFMSSGSYGIVGTGTLAGNSASTTPQALSITTNHTVNNQNAYYLKFQSEGNAGSNIRLYGVRITYTVNKAD